MERAIWHPCWYELDRAIEVGEVSMFEFFHRPPPYLAQLDVPVFYHGDWGDRASYYSARNRIAAIHHPEIGAIRKIDTRGLDYTFVLVDGTVMKVEAEERPGYVYSLSREPQDWSITVEMEPA